jgi:hypothetical protein
MTIRAVYPWNYISIFVDVWIGLVWGYFFALENSLRKNYTPTQIAFEKAVQRG